MKLAYAELPKIQKSTRQTLDEKVTKEAIADLSGSFDFAPHAYTDGKEYETYGAAQAAANLTIRSVADSTGEDQRMLRRRVWHAKGEKDRSKKGPWIFAVSRRSTPPKERKPRVPAQVAA